MEKYLIIEFEGGYETDFTFGEVIKLEDTPQGKEVFESNKSLVTDVIEVDLQNNLPVELFLMQVGLDTYRYNYLNKFYDCEIKKLQRGTLLGNNVYFLELV